MSTDERTAVFELTAYLVACARLALDEPEIHGSFRLVEGASRLIASGLADDPFLAGVREEIEREKLRMIDDREGYTEWLTRLLRTVGAETKRRNLA
jgi:hypothetical protein